MQAHVPVLRAEALQTLSPRPGESVLDCTLGLGGHAVAFLEATSPDGRLIGLDADAGNLAAAGKNLGRFATRIDLQNRNFRDVAEVPGVPVGIVFADLGVSSPHFDDPERGFSFRKSGDSPSPLDMRYDRSRGQSAAELLITSSVEDIARMFREFGELQRSKHLAEVLHLHFHAETRPLHDWKTDDVVGCVEKVFTYRAPGVLPQVFQALRIAVNDELGALRFLLDALPSILLRGGRAGIISYHSLEDRMVKQAFRTMTTPVLNDVTGQVSVAAPFELLTKKAVSPSAQELAENPRSRSAKFRAIRKL
ncbi:16S rRNA (cytosine(1402)-N(4))-methyltransferase RsmH [Candidatus Peribacteria bacterium]|nr:16S rRNA (cytosine(1402)-N(4))-methyltransferase RsmH [Candidatus Peribacteria bacterium]